MSLQSSQEETGFDVQTRFRTTKLLIEPTLMPPILKIMTAKLMQEKKSLDEPCRIINNFIKED